MFTVPSPEAVLIAQTYGLWIQTGAIVLSAVAAFALIIYSRKIACRRATLDLIMTEQSNDNQIKDRNHFINLRNKGQLVKWATADHAGTEESAIIRSALNRYELVAIGIKRNTVDGKLYKQWCRSTFIKDWTACKPFVAELRNSSKNKMFYSECEKLAKKWAKGAERDHV